MITFLFVIICLYVIQVFLITFNVMKEISYRSKNFAHHVFYDFNYSTGKKELVLKEFEDVSDYDIYFKTIICIPLIGYRKGVVFFKYEFESYKDGKLISGSWDKWWYGKCHKVYIERNGLNWNMVNILEQP